MLHGACVGEKAGARNLVFFRVKWLQAAMKRYLMCVTGAATIDSSENRFLLCVLQRVVVHARVFLTRFLNLWLQIAVQCCTIVVVFRPHVRGEIRLCHVMLQNAV